MEAEWRIYASVSKLSIIGSGNGLSSRRHKAIIWTNTGILLIWTLGTNFNEILSEFHTFSCKKMYFKMSSAKWRALCPGLNVLTQLISLTSNNVSWEQWWVIIYYFRRSDFKEYSYRTIWCGGDVQKQSNDTKCIDCCLTDSQLWINGYVYNKWKPRLAICIKWLLLKNVDKTYNLLLHIFSGVVWQKSRPCF